MYFLVELITSKTFFFRMPLTNGINFVQNIPISIIIFRNALLKFTRPVERKIFDINGPKKPENSNRAILMND